MPTVSADPLRPHKPPALCHLKPGMRFVLWENVKRPIKRIHYILAMEQRSLQPYKCVPDKPVYGK